MTKSPSLPFLSYAAAVFAVQEYLARRYSAQSDLTHNLVSETLPLAQAAGRVLAVGVHADRDQPPFPRSTRDGYACRATDAASHQFLRLTGKVRAGETPADHLNSGEAWEIMTGAPVPQGADAVFMVEHGDQPAHSPDLVRLMPPRELVPGENIVPMGAEAHKGDLLVAPGQRIGPAHIAIAAQCGYSQLTFVRQPRVAILSTGDELVPVEGTPGPSQIRNSNSTMLAALVIAAGGIPLILPAVPDEDSALDEAIAQAITADMLLITGGISAGKFDLVEGALSRAGAQFSFGGVAMQPGKPVAFGQLPREAQTALPFFALPGNPISSAVTFHLFASRVVASLAGDTGPQPRFALAKLSGEWRGKPGLTRVLPALCDFGHLPQVSLVPWQGSGDIAAFARSNCFVFIPDDASQLTEGALVRILLI